MDDENCKSDTRQEGHHRTNPVVYSLCIGFYAGMIWGLARWLATSLNFTKVPQAFLADPFFPRRLLGSFAWQSVGYLLFILMSILAGLLYLILLGRLRGPWPGLFFGAVWWALLYALAGPLVGAVPPLRQVGWNSLITDFCLFLVWGVFIGYSIAFEFHDESEREPNKGGSSRKRAALHG